MATTKGKTKQTTARKAGTSVDICEDQKAERGAQVRSRGQRVCGRRDERDEARQAQERRQRQDGSQPEAGHRNRVVGGAQGRRQGSEKTAGKGRLSSIRTARSVDADLGRIRLGYLTTQLDCVTRTTLIADAICQHYLLLRARCCCCSRCCRSCRPHCCSRRWPRCRKRCQSWRKRTGRSFHSHSHSHCHGPCWPKQFPSHPLT